MKANKIDETEQLKETLFDELTLSWIENNSESRNFDGTKLDWW